MLSLKAQTILCIAAAALLAGLQGCGGSSSGTLPSPLLRTPTPTPTPKTAAWPMFRQNPRHTGLSPFSTASDTGVQKWKFTTGGLVLSSPAAGTDGAIYVGSDDGNLYAVNPDGNQKWKFTTADRVRSSPAVGADGTIYVGSDDGNLYAVNPDGSQKWKWFETSFPYSVRSSPAVGADGRSTSGRTLATSMQSIWMAARSGNWNSISVIL